MPISPDFSDADVLCMLQFIIENVDKYVKTLGFHGQRKARPVELLNDVKKNVRQFLNKTGPWSYHALQTVSLLACDVVAFLGGNCDDVYEAKEKMDNTLIQRLISTTTSEVSAEAAGSIDDIPRSPKRKLDDVDFDKVTEFVMEVMDEVEEAEEGQRRKIAKLALEENNVLLQIWRAIETKENRKEKIGKFLWYTNLVLDVNLTLKANSIPEGERAAEVGPHDGDTAEGGSSKENVGMSG
ncbi:hypothetical protein BC936DRAFT_145641 [Jimgerdemannia flammicorona]|uniref:Uncharacterized protein n=1 Tax=Jimgerdemannia flammicorona TaxID=994334 RepID=A0A433D9G1_9FUNG|nr:hypothetical protein BC936DRAFT_145641 [Jimgerdemannia flammicorona]